MLGPSMALGSALVWAMAVVLYKRSEAVSPQALNLFKNVLSFALLVATLAALGVAPDLDRPPGDWLLLAASGVLGIAVADTLVFVALRHLGAGLLAIVETVYAPCVVLLSVALLGEPLRAPFLLGGALVVGGVTLAIWDPTVLRPARSAAHRRVGIACGVAGILSMATGIVLAKPILETGHLAEVMLARLAFGIVGQLAWLAGDPDRGRVLAVFRPGPVWRTLVPAAVLGNYVAMFLWLGGFKWAPASVAAVLNQMATVFTILLARIFLAEPISPRRALGGATAVAGAVFVLLA